MKTITGKTDIEHQILFSIKESIKSQKLILPSLPDVAMKVRQTVNNPDCTADQIGKLLVQDPAMSARLLKVVNSAALRGSRPITNIRSAITRMGMTQVRMLVTSLSIIQMFNTRNTALTEHVKHTVEHSVEIGSACYAISRKFPHLDADAAMLAGLVHDIGVLPLMTFLNSKSLNQFRGLLQDSEKLDKLVESLHPQVGAWVLEDWNFSPEIIAVALEHEDIFREGNEKPDYVDIVIAANLESYAGTAHRLAEINRSEVPAITKLGLQRDDDSAEEEKIHQDMNNAMEILMV